MKHFRLTGINKPGSLGRGCLPVTALAFALFLSVPRAPVAAETGKSFATPEEAVSALGAAVNNMEPDSLRELFGPAVAELIATDAVQAKNELVSFTSAFNAAHQVVRESETNWVVEIGRENWPFPIPIVRREGRWFFDTEAGREELINRRIGRNELSNVKVLRACVEAQREFASQDRNGDGVLEFARKFISSPGAKDGLFWEPDLDGSVSPLGPLVAHAHSQGYGGKKNGDRAPEPFHGYFFKVLTRQGKHAAGGKYNYVINGYMIGGFAIVAWPADYSRSGVMSFMVNQQGRVYQKNLGPRTARLVADMTAYDPDATWNVSPD